MLNIRKEYITEKELAALTGFRVKTIQQWRVHDRGPCYKKVNGHAVRYHINDVRAWLRACPTRGGCSALIAEDSVTTTAVRGNHFYHDLRRSNAYRREE